MLPAALGTPGARQRAHLPLVQLAAFGYFALAAAPAHAAARGAQGVRQQRGVLDGGGAALVALPSGLPRTALTRGKGQGHPSNRRIAGDPARPATGSRAAVRAASR